ELNLKGAYGNLIPSLSLNGNWSRNNAFSSGGTIYQNGIPIQVGDQITWTNNLSLGINTSVVLFDGTANYQNISLEKQNLAVLRTNYEKTKQDIIVKIYQRFFDVIKKQKIVETNIENLRVSTEQLNSIKEYVNVGKKTQSDIYKQDVLVARNELNILTSKNDYEKSKVELLNSMYEDVTKSIDVDVSGINVPTSTDELNVILVKYSDYEKLVYEALSSRYDYKSIIEDIKANELKLSIAKKYIYYPTLSAFGNYNVSGNQIDEITNNRVLTFGLSLSYPIFQGFQRDISKQVSEVNIKQRKEDLSQLERNIRSEIKKAIFDLQTAYKQIEIVERNIRSSEQDKYLSEENFRLGYGTLLDVQVATTALNNLQIDRINFIYNFMISQKYLEYLAGIIKY
ncbi:MAG: TolC family protein, partial [Ignavibacteria bacterium]|nr:TolC family protein [Ignavibacteria bacterium]